LIELSVADAPRSDVGPAALLDACTAGSGGRGCVLVDAADRADSDIVAKVAWTEPDGRLANIRLGLGRADHRSWQARNIEFKATDDPTERWRSVGLVIAGVAAEPSRAVEPTESQHPAEIPDRGKDAEPRHAQRRFEPWLEAGLVVGPAVNDGSWKGGAWARGSLAIAPWPLGVTTSLAYERRLNQGDFELHLPSATAGIFGFVDVSRWTLTGRVEVMERLVVLSASDGVRNDTHHRWQTGLRAGWAVGAPIGAKVSAVGGLDFTWAPSAEIQVRNVPIGRIPSASASGFLGVRGIL
jgi:hypothetical protein